MEIIKLRGHHLEGTIYAHKYNLDDFSKFLIISNYVKSKEDFFVNYTYYGLKNLFSNSDNLVKIVEDEEDFICKECPKRKKEGVLIMDYCKSLDVQSILGNVFSKAFESDDKKIAKIYGLKIDEIYSVGEIKKKLGILNGSFKSKLSLYRL